jgi:hypothetical protein
MPCSKQPGEEPRRSQPVSDPPGARPCDRMPRHGAAACSGTRRWAEGTHVLVAAGQPPPNDRGSEAGVAIRRVPSCAATCGAKVTASPVCSWPRWQLRATLRRALVKIASSRGPLRSYRSAVSTRRAVRLSGGGPEGARWSSGGPAEEGNVIRGLIVSLEITLVFAKGKPAGATKAQGANRRFVKRCWQKLKFLPNTDPPFMTCPFPRCASAAAAVARAVVGMLL